MSNSPFELDNVPSYAKWRERKLDSAPRRIEDILVPLDDPRALTATELDALLQRCSIANMAIYTSNTVGNADKEIPRRLGTQLGLHRLDSHWLTDDDAISPISVRGAEERSERKEFIPYTDKPIRWHTDGYYNTVDRRICGMVLHCVQSAEEGGDNRLLDHEIAYILLRDHNPAHIRALSEPDAMTIPARLDESGIARAEETGPVFSVLPSIGALHMRYTARTKSIVWKDTPEVKAAVAALEAILAADSPYIFHVRLAPGMGLICNNVLHDRTGFDDSPQHKRVIYRARYHDRMRGCDLA